MRSVLISMAAFAAVTGVPAMAGDFDYDWRDRGYVSGGEIDRSRDRVERERRDVREAYRYGDRGDIREERRELARAERDYQRDVAEFRRNQQIYRNDGRDWRRGQYFGYNRPDPRYGAYYANNYYRDGGYYRQRPLYANDRIYRGNDNRYYCRRSDGTTGLVVGALSGGVLGNLIAPGGSKTLGSILGGGLGAVLGSSIDRGTVTCR